MKKIISFMFIFILALFLVSCGDTEVDDGPKTDPLVPTAISLKVKTAKVQITKTLKLTYTISPATAQANAVKVSCSNNIATATVEGTNSIILTAGSEAGTVKVTVTTTNGISASKTIKVQVDEVEDYPDLSGYSIKIAQAESALGEIDVRLTKETADKYGYYSGEDREFKLQAWEEVEDNYNCTLDVVAYPSDAPWGPSRWNYILTQAQNEAPEYDVYVVESSTIPGFVAGNAVEDLTDWYAEYGKNLMNDMAVTACSYKGRIYALCPNDIKTEEILGYNVNLFKQLQEQDPNLVEPAQMYLDGNWNYDSFKNFCLQAQQALNTLYGTSGDSYYCLSGYGCYYWRGMVQAAGLKVLDTTQLKCNIDGTIETAAAQTLQDIYAAGAMDPSFQVDGSVATWNAGHSLFNTGGFWFYNHSDRWTKDLWGSEENTQYGFVPFPTNPGNDINYTGTTADGFYVMASARDWAYKGFGDECTAENVFRAFMDYEILSRYYYKNSEGYNYVDAITGMATARFGSEASVKAFIKVMCGTQQEDGSYVGGLDDYGFYDPFCVDNAVVSSYGASGTFAGTVNDFIKGSSGAQWVDAVGTYKAVINKGLVDAYG